MLAEVTGQDYKRILKKEAQYFIESIFEELEPISIGDTYSRFGSSHQLLTGKKLRDYQRNVHFEFKHQHCHAIFNDSLPYENNIPILLCREFELKKEEMLEILRKNVKRLLKRNNIVLERRIKIFIKPF